MGSGGVSRFQGRQIFQEDNASCCVMHWRVWTCTFWGAAVSGLSYSYGVYSEALKKKWNLSQGNLELIPVVSYSLGFLSFAVGAVADQLKPRRSTFIAGALMPCSLLLFWAVATGRLPAPHALGPPIVSLVLIWTTLFPSQSLLTAAMFSSVMKSVPKERKGVYTGLTKAWVGLAGGLFTTVYAGVYAVPDDSPRTLDFLVFLAITCVICTWIPAPFLPGSEGLTPVSVDDSRAPSREPRVWLALGVLLSSALVITVAALTKNGPSVRTVIAFILIALFAAPVAMALPIWSTAGDGPEILFSRPRAGRAVGSRGADDAQGRRGQQDFTTLGMVKTPDCWLLAVTAFIVLGGGLMVVTNVAQISGSRGEGSAAAAVALFSVAQCLGRLIAGSASDLIVYKLRVARPATFVLLSLLMAVAHFVFTVPGVAALYTGVALSGFAFGGVWPLMVVTVNELFGETHFGGNYMFYDGGGSAVGALGFGKFLPQTFYERNTAPGSTDCHGMACFRDTNLIIAACCLASTVTGLLLTCRTQTLYLANAVERDLSRASSFAINDDGDGKEDRLLGERSYGEA